MEKEAYLTFEDHEDFRRAVEEVLHDREESFSTLSKDWILFFLADFETLDGNTDKLYSIQDFLSCEITGLF